MALSAQTEWGSRLTHEMDLESLAALPSLSEAESLLMELANVFGASNASSSESGRSTASEDAHALYGRASGRQDIERCDRPIRPGDTGVAQPDTFHGQ